MSRDRVKNELADSIRRSIEGLGNGLVYRLTDNNVADVEATKVSELETQVKVLFKNGPPRYFIVKVTEKF